MAKSIIPEQFINVEKMSRFLELAVEHYQKHAPAWFVAYLEEVYERLAEGWQKITMDEVITISKLYEDGQWQYETYAVNNAYKLFDRMGRSTTGIAGY